ncbi:DJ-1/PfpI family protein [Anaerocolumna aminovalerica]|uniref:DJ-1/PfpI family protein n=1 Tax=Anaerocolumna aminovalerica TaxID=1527 RepID=UPI00248CDBF5|nr:DJ-1/PfpI family protein [Anaerocolumna aminovalerica]
MKNKKTAILLFDLFSNYELSVALSILSQGKKQFDFFGLKDEVISEEDLHAKCTKILEEIVIEEYDSLLIPGCMDLEDIISSERILNFLRKFDSKDMIIASISSSPILLLKAGILENRRFMAGVIKEELVDEGFTMEQMKNMVDIKELRENYDDIGPYIVDDNILTSVGCNFIQFGIQFGKMLSLDFQPGWYGVNL